MMELNHGGSRLTAEEIDHIAEKAAEKALEKVYEEVGRSVLKKLFWIIGVVSLGLLLFLTGKGIVAIPGGH